MSTFIEYYVPKVEEFLRRSVKEEEIEEVKERYTKGWHPRRVAEYLLDPEGNPEGDIRKTEWKS